MRWHVSSIIPRPARERALDDVADRLPGGAVELHQPHLLDGAEVGRPGVDGNARQDDRAPVILQRRCLPHDVLARQIVAALGQNLKQRFGRGIAEDGVAILLVAIGIIFVHERQPGLDGRVFLPGGVAGVLEERGRDHANGILKPRRSQRVGDRSRRIDQQQHRMPIQFSRSADGARRDRRRAIEHEHFGTGTLEDVDLGIDRHIRLDGNVGRDHARR